MNIEPIPQGIHCGCGWSVNTGDNSYDRKAHETHVEACPSSLVDRQPWIAYVFSVWGFFILLLVAITVIKILGK